MKPLIGLLFLLGLSVASFADDVSIEVSPAYSKPFRSPGFSGTKADGIGARISVETGLSSYLALGLNYEALKIDEQADSANFGFGTAFLRFTPADWDGARPYFRLDMGALVRGSSNDPAQNRNDGLVTQGGIGALFVSKDQPWILDAGVDVINVAGGAGLNLLQGHFGVLVRFGSPTAAPGN